MKFLCTVLCAALGFATGLASNLGPVSTNASIGIIDPNVVKPLTPADINASNNLKELLEYIRRLMPVGINRIVVVTEPYKADILPDAIFNNPESKMKGTVQLSNLVAAGASSYVIDKLEVRVNNSRVDFQFSIPVIQAELDYITKGFVYDPFVFDTSGHLKLTLEDLQLVGTLLVAPNFEMGGSSTFSLVALAMETYVGNVKVDANIEVIPTEVIKEITDVLAYSLLQAAAKESDAVLSHFTIEQILTFLLV